jgi:hypothetical protein
VDIDDFGSNSNSTFFHEFVKHHEHILYILTTQITPKSIRVQQKQTNAFSLMIEAKNKSKK